MQAPSERTALENRVVEEADRIYTLDRQERQRLVCRIEAYQNVLRDNPVRSKTSVAGRKQHGFKVYQRGCLYESQSQRPTLLSG